MKDIRNSIRLAGRSLTYIGLLVCLVALLLAAIANLTDLIEKEWWIRLIAFFGVSAFVAGGCITIVYAIVFRND